ncbi:MAG: high frequency lysogenization protein HflD [Granulosicoccaceae bacterium]
MSSIHTIENQTLALAGIFQAVHLCKALATTGECDQDDLRGTLRSILTLKADRVADAYGGNSQSMRRGLRVLKNQLISNDEQRDLDISRYALGLIQLGTNILKDQKTVEQLRIGISQAQSMEGSIIDTEAINALASIYRTSISQLSPRIMVNGNEEYLADNAIASSIRASLLGGVRSVVLWRQCGGTRPKLLLQRGKHLQAIEKLLMA